MRFKFKYISILGLAALAVTTGCNKNDSSVEKLSLNRQTTAYTPVTMTPVSKVVNPSVLDNTSATFDTHQAWFDFTTINVANPGHASLKEGWHLGFWNGAGFQRVILNYAVTTQASQLPGISTFPGTTLTLPQTNAIKSADALITGGAMGMGDLSTFDFHRDSQFVIGAPASNKVYLLKTIPVKKHPDSTATVSYWLVNTNWTGTQYQLQYRALQKTGSGATATWAWASGTTATKIATLSKTPTQQYSFVKLTVPTGTATETPGIQPSNSNWNLGLSSVTLKRYFNPDFVDEIGDTAYAFSLKGVVLNNNSGVEVYTVKSTSGGAPGPYDPNFSGYGSSDPAITTSNESAFGSFAAANIVDANFRKNSQEEIGQYWRYLDMGLYQLFLDRFFVIKLPNGNVYKLKFDNLDAPYYNSSTNQNQVNGGIKYRYAQIAKTP